MVTSENKIIAIIGVGHMGKAFQQGLLTGGFKKENIILSNNENDNRKAVKQAEWIMITVRPLIVESVLSDIKDLITDKLLVSVAAGVTVSKLQKYSQNKKQKIIRLMPNIPVSVNNGVIGMWSNKSVSKSLQNEVFKVFSMLGTVIEVNKEEDLDTLTLISSCGPAIVSYFLETLTQNGELLGLSLKISEKIVLETVKGTLLYLEENKLTFADLQNLVATKGGVTKEIINSMNNYKFKNIFTKSIQNGYVKLNQLKSLDTPSLS